MADGVVNDNNIIDVSDRLDKLALDVLELSKNTLLVNLRFMDVALNQLVPTAQPGSLSTDGEHLFYDARFVLKRYMAEKELPVRDYLHTVLHCVLHHNFEVDSMEAKYWNLACDIAVENIINELDIKSAAVQKQPAQIKEIENMKGKVSQLTADKIYKYLTAESMTPEELARLADLFLSDDHEGWYEEFVPESDEENSPDSQEKPDEQDSSDDQDKVEDNQPQQQQQQEEPQEQNQFQMPQQSVLETVEAPRQQEIEEIWKDISERMQVDLETLSKGKGDARGGLMQNLRPLNKKRYDYTTFLRKFSVLGEELKVNDDEFDYIFYTYGLKLYEKMPLIEPLEYKEDKRIRDFVIAIDTSGSVKGDMVQKFVEKTYSILKQSESFFNKINLHIIQCDAEIQQDVKITSQEEFDDYIKNMKLFGFGGTDFRPVFEYVEKLREEKEFTDLRGLIYFTDGDGTFPKKMPDYKAAFVFIETEEDGPPVPPWAIQLVLEADDI